MCASENGKPFTWEQGQYTKYPCFLFYGIAEQKTNIGNRKSGQLEKV